MKKLLPVFLILFLGCKKEEFTLAPVVSYVDFSIKELRIAGVPDGNIKFGGTSIFVTLPADYRHGNVLKVAIKTNRDFVVETDLSNGINFEAKDVLLSVASPTFSNASFRMFVKPTAPLKVIPQGTHDVTVGAEAYVSLAFQNFGTISTHGADYVARDKLKVTLKNTESGDTIVLDRYQVGHDSLDRGIVMLNLPVTASAGKYEAEVQWGNRLAKVPYPINIKYGKLALDAKRWSFDRSKTDKILVSGYNIHPDSKYEILIENDFMPLRRYELNRDNYNSLSLKLPGEIKSGNYKAQILVDNKPYPVSTYEGDPATNLLINSSENQPVISFVSQPSLLISSGCNYYKPTNTISRIQDIVSNSWAAGESDIKLKLVNRETRQAFLLTSNNPRFRVMCFGPTFDQYTIPKEVPNGEYEIYSAVESAPIKISESLGQIITIK
jgi:hypothetical protein